VRGSYAATASLSAPAAGFVPAGGLEALPLAEIATDTTVWAFDPALGTWRGRLPEPLASLSELGPLAGPASALYVEAALPGGILRPPASARVRFHHGDHLGSTGVVTDGEGRLVEETAYYPFGEPRHRLRAADFGLPSSNYLFGGKERDFESGLQYFEARYYAAPSAHFTSVDPIRLNPIATPEPQRLNAYAYALNSPLAFVDPSGESPWSKAKWFGDYASLVYTVGSLVDDSKQAKFLGNLASVYSVVSGGAQISYGALDGDLQMVSEGVGSVAGGALTLFAATNPFTITTALTIGACSLADCSGSGADALYGTFEDGKVDLGPIAHSRGRMWNDYPNSRLDYATRHGWREAVDRAGRYTTVLDRTAPHQETHAEMQRRGIANSMSEMARSHAAVTRGAAAASRGLPSLTGPAGGGGLYWQQQQLRGGSGGGGNEAVDDTD
jgi:RHS repeat-associated protein